MGKYNDLRICIFVSGNLISLPATMKKRIMSIFTRNRVKLCLMAFFTFYFSLSTLLAQDRPYIDSLQKVLKKYEAHKKELGNKATPLMDSTKALLLCNLSGEYWGNNSDTAMYYARQSLSLSTQIGFKKGLGKAYNSIAVINWMKGNYPVALDYFQKSLKANQEANYTKGIAYCYMNMGNVYFQQGNYDEALKVQLKALKYFEDLGYKKGIGDTYLNIGLTYYTESNYPEALNYYLKSLKIAEELKDKRNSATCYANIGLIYENQENFNDALQNFESSLTLRKEMGDQKGTSDCYNNIGGIYLEKNDYSKAMEYFLNALKIEEQTGDNDGSIQSYSNLGLIFFRQKNYSEAIKNYQHSIKIAEQSGDKEGLSDVYNSIGLVYEMQGNLNEALVYEAKGLSLAKKQQELDKMKDAYKHLADVNAKLGNYKAAFSNESLFKQINDSIYNKENAKKLTAMQMRFDYNKKQDSVKAVSVKQQDSIKAEAGKRDALNTKEIENQKRIRNYVVGGLGIVLFFLAFVFIQRNKIAREKKRSDELLLNILPSEVADELKEKGSAEAKTFDEVTVMFTDFKGFTSIAEKLSAKELVAEIDYCFKGFDDIIHKYNIEKIKTIGDSYMAAGGLPVANKTHGKDVVNAAIEIVEFMENHKKQRIKEGKEIFEIRIGINSGHVVAGIVGVKKFAYDIWGDTVNLASRMESSGEPGKVNISGSTYELVKNDFSCTYRGKIKAKNKGEVDMYFIS